MKSRLKKIKLFLTSRWSEEEYPGGEPTFRFEPFLKEVGAYFALIFISVAMTRSCTSPSDSKKQMAQWQTIDTNRFESSKTQIINFGTRTSNGAIASRRSPGTLVKVKLLNVVETHTTAPVHAQIIDESLGQSLVGGTLIGDATPDSNFQRINITFRFARDPLRAGIASSMSARALGLDGTLGLIAEKKEGFFTRSAISSANTGISDSQSGSGNNDLKEMLFRALTAGLVQEFGSAAQVEKNRSQVLTLKPSTVFYAELTDYFPGGTK